MASELDQSRCNECHERHLTLHYKKMKVINKIVEGGFITEIVSIPTTCKCGAKGTVYGRFQRRGKKRQKG